MCGSVPFPFIDFREGERKRDEGRETEKYPLFVAALSHALTG